MAIIETVQFGGFQDAFVRADRKENFSYQGKQVLFDYLEGVSDDTGEPIELDVIALCCEYSEMDCAEIAENYADDAPTLADCDDDTDELADKMESWLSERTSVCGRTDDGAFVFAQF